MASFAAVPGYLLEVIDDEVLLYHPAQETMVYCNATAAYVWRLCDGTRTVDDIVQLLRACYPDAADIAAQVQSTIDALCARGVLKPADAAPCGPRDRNATPPRADDGTGQSTPAPHGQSGGAR